MALRGWKLRRRSVCSPRRATFCLGAQVPIALTSSAQALLVVAVGTRPRPLQGPTTANDQCVARVVGEQPLRVRYERAES